jgi:4-hydroxybenzoate polyprenyltransferase
LIDTALAAMNGVDDMEDDRASGSGGIEVVIGRWIGTAIAVAMMAVLAYALVGR